MKKVVFIFVISVVLFFISVPVTAQRINFAYQNGVNYVTAMVAEKMGFFAHYDLEVDGKIFTSGPLVSESIISGAAEIGMMGDTPAIIAVTKNLPVVILASVAGGPARNRLMISCKSNIQTLSDLEGKRIGIPFGTSSHGALYSLAQQNQLAIETMHLFNIRPADMVEALATHQVDAVIVWEPTPSIIEDSGAGKELMTLAGIGNEFPTFLLVNIRLLKREPDIGIRFLKALDKANHYIQENWEEAVAIASEFTGLKEEIMANAMEYIYYDINLSDETIASFQQTAYFLKEYKSIDSLPILNTSIDGKYLKEMRR